MFGNDEDLYQHTPVVKDDYTDPSNPRVWMDIAVGSAEPQRMEFELYANCAPKCAENFRALCTGEKGKADRGFDLHYKGKKFHRNIDGFMLQGGDIEHCDTPGRAGTGGSSIYGEKFADEPFLAQHTKRGMLSMANAGPNTNGSQFFILYKDTPHLNGKHVVFGNCVKGFTLLDKFEAVKGDSNDSPDEDIRIVDCGQCEPEKSE